MPLATITRRRRRPRATVPGRGGIYRGIKGQPFKPTLLPRGMKGQPFKPTIVPRGTAPTAPKAPAAPAGPPPLVDDAQAAADRAKALFDRTQKLNELNTQGAYDKTDFAEALRRMADQRPRDEQSTRETANTQGLFYSGQLGKRLGDVAIDYGRRESDSRQAFDRRDAARAAARQAIEQGAPIEDAAITAALVDRNLERDTLAADVGGLAPPDGAAAAPGGKPKPRAKGKPSKPKKTKRKRLTKKQAAALRRRAVRV